MRFSGIICNVFTLLSYACVSCAQCLPCPLALSGLSATYSPERNFRPGATKLKEISNAFDAAASSQNSASSRRNRIISGSYKELKDYVLSLDSSSLLMYNDSLSAYVGTLVRMIQLNTPEPKKINFQVMIYRTLEANASSLGEGIVLVNLETALIDNNGKLVWKNVLPVPLKKAFDSEYAIYANDRVYVSTYMTRPRAMSMEGLESYYIFHNMDDGKEIFRLNAEGFKFPFSNPDIIYDKANDQYIMSGEYQKKGDSQSQGFFLITLNNSGKVLKESYSSWKEDIGKLIKLNDKRKLDNDRSVFVQQVIRTDDGKVFAIAEQYKKAMSGLGTAGMILGGNTSAAKVELYDMMVFEFDHDLKIQKVSSFEKQKTDVDLPRGFGLNGSVGMGYLLKVFGWFDYGFTVVSPDRKTFNCGYVNYDKDKEEGKGYVAGSISYTVDQTLVQDKIRLKDKPTLFAVLPSKPGYIAIFEYFEKQKRINVRLEKLNI